MRALTCGDAPQRRSPDVDDKRGLGFKSLGAYFREIHLFYRTNNTLKSQKPLITPIGVITRKKDNVLYMYYKNTFKRQKYYVT